MGESEKPDNKTNAIAREHPLVTMITTLQKLQDEAAEAGLTGIAANIGRALESAQLHLEKEIPGVAAARGQIQ